MTSPIAHIKPALLIWARTMAGYSVESAAQKAGVKAEKVEAWERGEDKPTIAQLRELAGFYKRPLAVFFLSEPPKGWDAMRDFRRLPEAPEKPQSTNLLFAVREAWERRQVASELGEELDYTEGGIRIRARTTQDPDEVAARIRQELGIELDEQWTWRTPDEALSRWRARLESLGFLIFSFGRVPVVEARGFAITERPFPVLATNSNDSPAGRVFSLMHELTHVVLGGGTAMCDLVEQSRPPIEVFCNRVAGAILVPSEALLHERLVSAAARGHHWTDDELRRLAQRFSVSQEVVLRRLLILGRATSSFYQAKRPEFQAAYESWVRKRKEAEGGPSYLTTVLSQNGRLYTRLVLEAYAQSSLTASEVSSLLGVRTKHIQPLQADLAMRGAPG